MSPLADGFRSKAPVLEDIDRFIGGLNPARASDK